jgi:hypothetical protein
VAWIYKGSRDGALVQYQHLIPAVSGVFGNTTCLSLGISVRIRRGRCSWLRGVFALLVIPPFIIEEEVEILREKDNSWVEDIVKMIMAVRAQDNGILYRRQVKSKQAALRERFYLDNLL